MLRTSESDDPFPLLMTVETSEQINRETAAWVLARGTGNQA